MPSKQYTKNGYICNQYGAIEAYREGPNDKNYAVIARCGHCGNGYFIPIMFGIVAKDLQTAIEVAKIKPRVKRLSTNAILDAFEVTFVQRLFIDAVNSRDAYLRNNVVPNEDYLHSRRLANPKPSIYKSRQEREDVIDVHMIIDQTADDFAERDVLQRFFAPIKQGDKYVYRNRVNHQELLDEFFYQNTIKYGILKDSPYFIILYYQIYGEDNPLHITYKDNALEYPLLSGYVKRIELTDLSIQKLGESGIFDPVKPPEEREEFLSSSETKIPSQIDKFQRRLAKTKQMQTSNPTQRGE